MLSMIRAVSPVLSSLLLGASVLWPLQAHALFGDDEARKAIIDLRQKVDVNRQAADAAALEAREGQAVTRRSLLDLANQLEQLRAELARLRGQNEQLSREVSELQRLQKDVQTGLDERLRQVEPLRVTHDGVSFTSAPAEKRDFDAAMEVLRRSEFEAAAMAYTVFLRRYPVSGYAPSALYWLGNAQYAIRAYKESIDSHRMLATQFPKHLRAPEAMLAMANSQIELKDAKAARRTLEDLVKAYPESEAAAASRERLARLR
jgi:tol-pal system protein YbgF